MITFSITSHKIRQFFSNKTLKMLLILVFGIIIGVFCVKIYNHYESKDSLTDFYTKTSKLYTKEALNTNKNYNNDNFFDINSGFEDIFRDFREFEVKFDEHFKRQRELFEKKLEDFGRVNEGRNYYTSVDKEIKNQEILYKLNFKGYNENDIDVKIEKNTLTFSAVKRIEKDEGYSGSKFIYSLSIPNYNEKKGPEITRNKDNIVVKFLKKNVNK